MKQLARPALRHPVDLFKVRLRLATGTPGKWWACYVTDCEPAPDGCRQRPTHFLRGAYGDTPGMAYHNLMKGPAA
jgi:hypothetical protein